MTFACSEFFLLYRTWITVHIHRQLLYLPKCNCQIMELNFQCRINFVKMYFPWEKSLFANIYICKGRRENLLSFSGALLERVFFCSVSSINFFFFCRLPFQKKKLSDEVSYSVTVSKSIAQLGECILRCHNVIKLTVSLSRF